MEMLLLVCKGGTGEVPKQSETDLQTDQLSEQSNPVRASSEQMEEEVGQSS